MRIERETVAETTLVQFAEEHDLTMLVVERADSALPRYYARFKHAEIKDGSILTGVFGNGTTEQEAIRAYGARISMRVLVIEAYSDQRRVIHVPRLVLSQPDKGRGS